MTAQQFDLEAIQKMSVGSIPFAERSGLRLEAFEPGYVKMRIPLEGNQNHIGTMYAGALFTLSEIPGGALFMGSFDVSKYFPIVAEMNIKYLKPATTDITVEARLSAEEIARISEEADTNGKSVFHLELELKDTNEQVVAVTTGVYQARSHNYKKK